MFSLQCYFIFYMSLYSKEIWTMFNCISISLHK